MVVLGLVSVFLVLALVGIRWFSKRRKTQAEQAEQAGSRLPDPLRTLMPLVQHLAGYNRLLPLDAVRERYTRLFEMAGLRFELTADELLAVQELCGLAMAGVAVVVYSTVTPNLLVAAGLISFGLACPYIWLSAEAKKHRHACLLSLPAFLDMLVLAVEAGMGFDAAVRKLTEVLTPGPLTGRFQAYLRSMNVGKSRADALREMARKVDLPDLSSLVNAVVQATETGAGMGAVLRTESREMLLRRFERAEKTASELPIKMLFPLFAFVFPATFLMILGPLYFQFVASGAGGVLR